MKQRQLYDSYLYFCDIKTLFLGMHFSHAVATIQALVGSIKGVQILYSDKVCNVLYQKLALKLSNTKLLCNQIAEPTENRSSH